MLGRSLTIQLDNIKIVSLTTGKLVNRIIDSIVQEAILQTQDSNLISGVCVSFNFNECINQSVVEHNRAWLTPDVEAELFTVKCMLSRFVSDSMEQYNYSEFKHTYVLNFTASLIGTRAIIISYSLLGEKF